MCTIQFSIITPVHFNTFIYKEDQILKDSVRAPAFLLLNT